MFTAGPIRAGNSVIATTGRGRKHAHKPILRTSNPLLIEITARAPEEPKERRTSSGRAAAVSLEAGVAGSAGAAAVLVAEAAAVFGADDAEEANKQ